MTEDEIKDVVFLAESFAEIAIESYFEEKKSEKDSNKK